MIPSRQRRSLSTLVGVDPDGEVTQVTPDAIRTIGWNVGDLVSQRIIDELSSGSHAVFIEGTGAQEIGMQVYVATDGSGWLLTHDGTTQAEPRPGHADLGSETDLAYRAFFEQAPIGIAHLDTAGRVTFENHALRMIFGEDAESAWIGRSVYSIDAIGPYLKPLIERMLAEGQPFEARESCYAPRPESPNMWMRVSGTSIRDMDGRVAGGVITIYDVTDVKRAEAVLERERSRADADSRMKTELIATLSHELRTPVGTIRGYSEMLEDLISARGMADDQIAEFVGAIRERACDLERLVSDLIEFAHLETGLLSMQLHELRIDELVEDVVRSTVSAFENPVEVVTDLKASVSCVADPDRLKTVLSRVIQNALKFTAEGCVTIRTGLANGRVYIRIEDTGIGMDPEYVSRIFDPFGQADPVLNRRFEGAGLGLAVSKRVVERMGGEIAVESRQGHGTGVTIELPLRADQESN